MIYNSALANDPALDNLEPVSHVVAGRIRAFQHDLSSLRRLPTPYKACGVIYGEPPFDKPGERAFRERAGAEADSGFGFVKALRSVSGPMVLLGGAPLAAAMPPPDDLMKIRVDGSGKRGQGVQMRAFAWGLKLPPPHQVSHSTHLIDWLARRYGCIGDPFCGYGHTGMIAVPHAEVVLSDINPRCIAYIAANALSWQT